MPKKKITNSVIEQDVDNCSIVSVCSSEDSNRLSELCDELQISNPLDNIESNIDNLKAKRPETRVKYLKELNTCLQISYLGIDSNWRYFSTLLDGLLFSIENGTGLERVIPVNSISLLAFQFCSDDIIEIQEQVSTKLERFLKDDTLDVRFRSACASALANLLWMSSSDNTHYVFEVMNLLKVVFKGSCLKGDGKSPVNSAPAVDFHENALFCWFKLLLLLPNNMIVMVCKETIPMLFNILQNTNVQIRIAAAQVIGLLYEQIRLLSDESYRGHEYREILNTIQSFSVDNMKNKSKSDRKKQRLTMRNIYKYLQSGSDSPTMVKISLLENIELTSLVEQFQYDCVCDTLKIGVNKHLRMNPHVRDIFELGPCVFEDDLETRPEKRLNKIQKKYEHQFVSKVRKEHLTNSRSLKKQFNNSLIDEE